MNPFISLRDFLRPIHRPPAGGAGDAWVHHGFRAFLVLLIALAVPWLFPRTSLPEFDGLTPGVVADQTVIADFQFEVPKDPARLAEDLVAAEASVTPIVEYLPQRADSSIASTRAFFTGLDSAIAVARQRAADEGLDAEATTDLVRGAVNGVVSAIGINFVTDAELDYITSPGRRQRLEDELRAAFDGPLRAGVVRRNEIEGLTSSTVVIRREREDREPDDTVRLLSELVHMESFLQASTDSVRGRLPTAGATFFGQLLVQQARPTLTLDVEAFARARDMARGAVPRTSGHVLAGQRIVSQNEVVGELEYRRLQAYQDELIRRDDTVAGTGFLHDLGMVLLVASLLGVLVFATYTFRRDIYEELRSFSVLLALIVVVLAVAGVVAKTEGSPALIPIAFAGLLAAALFDSLLGLVVVSTIAGILLGQPEFSGLPAPMIAAAGGVTAAFAVRGIRTRSQSWVLIALISGAYVLAGLCLNLTGHLTLAELAQTALFGTGNAIVCTALAMGAILPPLEAFTRRTTEQSLLELADMNRPLLRRLSREAPGTYAHSINLANLVEAACEAIGANSLQGRVGVYYHDIGKLERPQYFIENQPKGLNPHDRLTPWQSAEILRDHVREGLRMADEARLPEVVKDFIREHHGTQEIRYFLEKARAEGGGADLDPNDFSYPGPKPRTKETGVAMLGDAVESASRALSEPSPERIRALIEYLVQDRVDQGQLDECGLTFRDLGIVKQQFAYVLTGLYHHRIDYPKPGHPPEAPARETGSADGAGRSAEPAPAGTPRGEPRDPLREEPAEAQISIELDRAAQGDTGPVPPLERSPRLDPLTPPGSVREGAGHGSD